MQHAKNRRPVCISPNDSAGPMTQPQDAQSQYGNGFLCSALGDVQSEEESLAIRGPEAPEQAEVLPAEPLATGAVPQCSLPQPVVQEDGTQAEQQASHSAVPPEVAQAKLAFAGWLTTQLDSVTGMLSKYTPRPGVSTYAQDLAPTHALRAELSSLQAELQGVVTLTGYNSLRGRAQSAANVLLAEEQRLSF